MVCGTCACWSEGLPKGVRGYVRVSLLVLLVLGYWDGGRT